MFVESTPNGELVKLLKETEEANPIDSKSRIKFVEKSGSKILNHLKIADPFGKNCDKEDCLACKYKVRDKTNFTNCRKNNIYGFKFRTSCCCCHYGRKLSNHWSIFFPIHLLNLQNQHIVFSPINNRRRLSVLISTPEVIVYYDLLIDTAHSGLRMFEPIIILAVINVPILLGS